MADVFCPGAGKSIATITISINKKALIILFIEQIGQQIVYFLIRFLFGICFIIRSLEFIPGLQQQSIYFSFIVLTDLLIGPFFFSKCIRHKPVKRQANTCAVWSFI